MVLCRWRCFLCWPQNLQSNIQAPSFALVAHNKPARGLPILLVIVSSRKWNEDWSFLTIRVWRSHKIQQQIYCRQPKNVLEFEYPRAARPWYGMASTPTTGVGSWESLKVALRLTPVYDGVTQLFGVQHGREEPRAESFVWLPEKLNLDYVGFANWLRNIHRFLVWLLKAIWATCNMASKEGGYGY